MTRHIIWYSSHTKLGSLLLAATQNGLCHVGMGDEAIITQDMHARFKESIFSYDNKRMAQYTKAFVEYIDNNIALPCMPIEINGTTFQQKVWQALMAIAPGQTLSYSKIAIAVAQPNASRAVANACAKNPLALIIPCHRIIREDGSLGGYYWGVARKQALLARETGRYPYPDAFSSFRQSTTHTS